MIKYYAYSGRPVLKQMIITVENKKITKQEFTGKTYKTIKEANKDMWHLNCNKGSFGIAK